MANSRGRGRNSMGQFLSVYGVSGGPAAVGQPTQVRTWGIPTGSGYRDRIGKWNFDSVRDWFRKRLRRRVYEAG